MTFVVGEVDARVGSVGVEWRDEFDVLPAAGAAWLAPVVTGSALLALDGNAAGARFAKVTLDPRDPTASVDLVGAAARALPSAFRVGWGVTCSRRSAYQAVAFGMAGVDTAGAVVGDGQTWSPIAGTGGIVVASSVATITTTAPHNLWVGARICVTGCADQRQNGFYLVTGIPSSTSFTFTPIVTGAATYGTTTTTYMVSSTAGSRDWIGVQLHDATSGNASLVCRAEGLTPWATAWNPGSTWDSAVIPSSPVNYATAYTYAQQPRHTVELLHERDWIAGVLAAVDSAAAVASQASRDQNIPLPAGGWVPRIRVANLPHLPAPIRITAASKAGSTTATLTVPGHGLTASEWVVIYGIRDQASFVNQAAAVVVASVVDANTITVAFGASTTATSYGGVVIRSAANTQPPGPSSSSVQSLSATAAGRLLVQFAASQGTYTVGESVCLVGVTDSTNTPQPAVEGLYRVARTDTAAFVVELDPMQGQTPPGSAITCGGALIAAPDVRLHFLRARSHDRVVVEAESGRGHSRAQSALPVTFAQAPSVSISGTPSVTATPVTATAHLLTAAASTNATSVKASAGTVYNIVVTNYSAAPKYLKLYNKASAPTVGTDVPIMTIPVPATSNLPIDLGATGVRFSVGIAFALVGAMPDADTTILAAGDVRTIISYV